MGDVNRGEPLRPLSPPRLLLSWVCFLSFILTPKKAESVEGGEGETAPRQRSIIRLLLFIFFFSKKYKIKEEKKKKKKKKRQMAPAGAGGGGAVGSLSLQS